MLSQRKDAHCVLWYTNKTTECTGNMWRVQTNLTKEKYTTIQENCEQVKHDTGDTVRIQVKQQQKTHNI